MSKADKIERYSFAAYYLALFSIFGSSFFLDSRLWGFNSWGYFSLPAIAIAIVTAAIIPIMLQLLSVRYSESAGIGGDRSFVLISASFAIGMVVCFWLLRGQTHFLGDGYQLLGQLALENPIAKLRNLGESWAHIGLKEMLGEGKDAALLSYRILSVASGAIFLLILMWATRLLYRDNLDRLLFLLGVGLGGYALLFFGYVENYSIFVAAVAAYCLTGMLVSRRLAPRWGLVLCFVAASLLHVFGLILLPSLVYLFAVDTRLGRRLSAYSRSVRIALIVVPGLILIAVAGYLYASSFYLRFAFVPPVQDMFTSDGYTLFSMGHLGDLGNQLFMLVPGLLVLIVALVTSKGRRTIWAPPYRHLLLVLIPSLIVLFLLDPRLGMSRDWDLFSFVGIPLALFCYSVILDRGKASHRYMVVMPAIILSLLILIPRVLVQAFPEKGIAMVKNLVKIDRARNRTTYFLLAKYYEELGNEEEGKQARRRWGELYPEPAMINEARGLRFGGRTREAVNLLWELVRGSPQYFDAWSNLGEAYLSMNMADSAILYLQIAHGLDRNVAPVLINIGAAHLHRGDFDAAEKALRRAMSIDSSYYQAPHFLSRVYRDRGDRANYLKYLTMAAALEGASANVFVEIAQVHIYRKQFAKARRALDIALAKGFDSTDARAIEESIPELQR